MLVINLNKEEEKENYFNSQQLLVRKKCNQCHKLLSIDYFIPYKWNKDFKKSKIVINNICSCCQKNTLEGYNRDFFPNEKDLNKEEK